MEMTSNALNWFEIPALDFTRAKRFYSAIFDFFMPEMQMGPNTMGFLLHEQGQGVGGAIVKGEGYVPSAAGTLVYLSAGSDLSVVMARVEPAGGRVLVGKTQLSPELGFFALVVDSEGNKIGLHSPH
jgi:predicted enzyme related to lactoylglutathione lyase